MVPHAVRVVFVVGSFLAAAAPAQAATFIVDDLTDTTDGSCAAPDCTLREAIDLANANGSAVTDDITFGGVAGGTIPVGALQLSALTTPTNIDGTTATGYNSLDPKPVIEIDGGGGGADSGFEMQGGSTITALSVNGFDTRQIWLTGTSNTLSANWVGIDLTGSIAGAGQSSAAGIYASFSNNTIGTDTAGGGNVVGGNDLGIVLQSANNTLYNNFVGTDRDGQIAVPNGDGIWLNGGNLNTIGGSAFNQGNLVSGNSRAGVLVSFGSSGNQLLGNNIGLTAGQGAALPNNRGVAIEQGDGNDIGGGGANEGNVIAGNTVTGTGVHITGLSNENRVQGNFIGISSTGTAFANQGSGVFVGLGATDNLIGGTAAGEGNVIANSGDNGVGILRGGSDTRGNRVLRNRIFASGDLGIDLGGNAGADGVTPNDANDADTVSTRANEGQNFPVITSAVRTGASTVAKGTLDTAKAGTPYRIEIYRSGICNAFGFGEGANFATAVTPTTNGSGDATFSVTVPGAALGEVLTATATDFPADPNTSGTSEFSACRTVTAPATGGGGPTPPPAGGSALPPPVTGKTFNGSVKRGTVSVKCPGDRRFRGIEGDNDLRFGCQIDTRSGRIALTTTAGGGRTQTALFYDGIFKASQTRGSRPITELRLAGKLENCGKQSRRASAAARKRKGRRLWGKGKGRFRTRGKRSSALVRGTTWLVEDRCDGSTLTRVAAGTVTVRDFARRRNVTVKKGRRYVAKARGTGARSR